MICLRIFLALFCLAGTGLGAEQATAKIIKVLPQFLDREGRNSTAPSLYARDAYQAMLRNRPNLRSGMQFAVQWKAHNLKTLSLRVEMRGMRTNEATTATLEMPVSKHGWFSTWSNAILEGDKYKEFGDLRAWRVTLWNGNEQLAEQTSFLW